MNHHNINWQLLENYNVIDARTRASYLEKIGFRLKNQNHLAVLLKSHFVIPGKTRYDCQKCGECCRYARKVATLVYEPCVYLSEDNTCSKNENKYLVCQWFPFHVFATEKYGNVLTIKPYCSGYGLGEIVNYDNTVANLLKLQKAAKLNDDGAFIVHELLYLPTKKDWVFPSKNNIDLLLEFINNSSGKQTNVRSSAVNSTELHYAQTTTNRLLGGIHEPQVSVNEQGLISDLNESFCNLLDNQKQNIAGKKLSDFFLDKEKILKEFQLGMSYGKISSLPEKLFDSKGKEKHVIINAITYRSREDGLVHSMLFCFKEVSQDLFIEISHSKNYARGLIESSLDLLVFLDRNGDITDVNQACCELVGRERHNIIGTSFIDYFDNTNNAKHGIEKTFKEGFVKNYVLNLKNSENEIIPVSFNASLFRDNDGIVQGMFASARDIRDTQNYINKLEQENIYTRSLIESSLDMMYVISKEGIILDVNTSACKTMNTQSDLLKGSAFASHFDDVNVANTLIREAFLSENLKDFRLVYKSKNFSFNVSKLEYDNGLKTVLLAIGREVFSQ